MELRGFLDATLPLSGNYFAAWTGGDGKLKQKSVATKAQLEIAIEKCASKNTNVYFGTGSFGKTRRQDDCVAKRCFYVDIDCKEGGQYATKQEAIRAFTTALKAGMPPPSLLIDSGNGYHLYWNLNDDAPPSEWERTAKLLVTACNAVELNIDRTVTADSARILRAPTSKNYKDQSNPKLCEIKKNFNKLYSLEDIHETLSSLVPTAPSLRLLPGGVEVDGDDLSGGMGSPATNAPAPVADAMMKGCGVFADNLRMGGKGTEEPIWSKLLLILAHTADGDDYVHKISDKHDDYSHRDTEYKWRREQAKVGSIGPVKCATLESAGCTQCAKCPLRERDTTPLVLAQKIPDGKTLRGFRNSNNGLERYDRDTSDFELVYHHPIHVKRYYTTPDPTDTKSTIAMLSVRIASETFAVSSTALTDTKAFKKTISNKGLSITSYSAEGVSNYMSSFMELLRERPVAHKAISQYGWVEDEFQYNGQLYGIGAPQNRHIDIKGGLETIYTPKGNLSTWTDCANYILGQDRPASWLTIATAFAAPIIKFTGIEASVVSIVSEGSGTGKSTAMKVAQSVWGNPKTGLFHMNDTNNAVTGGIETINNLPVYWDEVRGGEAIKSLIEEVVFRVAEGNGKKRMNSNAELKESGTWSTVVTLASNESILEHISYHHKGSDAGLARVFEVIAAPITDTNMSNADARVFYSRVSDNFGKAGVKYAEYLGANHDGIRDLVAKTASAISKRSGGDPADRFWESTMAALLVGASIANKLGLCTFDLKAFKTYLFEQLEAQKSNKRVAHSAENKTVDVIRRFMDEKADSMIKAKFVPTGGGRYDDTVMAVPTNLRGSVLIRVGTHNRVIRLHAEALKSWYIKTYGSGYKAFEARLVLLGAEIRSKANLDAGTAMGSKSNRNKCIDILPNENFGYLTEEPEEA